MGNCNSKGSCRSHTDASSPRRVPKSKRRSSDHGKEGSQSRNRDQRKQDSEEKISKNGDCVKEDPEEGGKSHSSDDKKEPASSETSATQEKNVVVQETLRNNEEEKTTDDDGGSTKLQKEADMLLKKQQPTMIPHSGSGKKDAEISVEKSSAKTGSGQKSADASEQGGSGKNSGVVSGNEDCNKKVAAASGSGGSVSGREKGGASQRFEVPMRVSRFPAAAASGSGLSNEPPIDLENPMITLECFIFL